MRTLINYIRSCFCKHEWELLKHEEAKYGQYGWLVKNINGHTDVRSVDIVRHIKIIKKGNKGVGDFTIYI